jgi:hypothetical protein
VLAGYIGILQSLKCHKICDFSIWWMKNKNFLSTVMFFFFVEFDKNWVRLSYCGCLLIILKLAMKPFVLIVLYIVWLWLLWIYDIHAYFFTAENWNTIVWAKVTLIYSIKKNAYHNTICGAVGKWLMSINWATTSTPIYINWSHDLRHRIDPYF